MGVPGQRKRGERNLIVLHAGDLFDDALAVRRPRVDAEREMRSGFHLSLKQSAKT